MPPTPQAVRVRTASGWQDVALVGPQGPAGGPLNAQQIFGTSEAYSSVFTGPGGYMQLWADAASTVPLRLTYTPPVDCWWDCWVNIGLVAKTSAEYTYMYGGLLITPADQDGVANQVHLITQHSTVQQYEGRFARRLFKLAAGTTYRVDGVVGGGSGGQWQYYIGKSQLSLGAIAFPRNVPPANPLAPPLVTALPGTPTDGQEVYYLADATNGVVWHLRYRAASPSSFKWECIGPTPLSASSMVATQQSAGSWAAADGGNSLAMTIPRSGDWIVRWSAQGYMAASATSYSTIGAGIGLNGSVTPNPAPSGGTQAHDLKAYQNGRNGHFALSNFYRSPYAAGDVLRIIFYTDSWGPQIYGQRMELTPVRLA